MSLTILDTRLDITDDELDARIKLLDAMSEGARAAYIARLYGAHTREECGAYAARMRRHGATLLEEAAEVQP